MGLPHKAQQDRENGECEAAGRRWAAECSVPTVLRAALGQHCAQKAAMNIFLRLVYAGDIQSIDWDSGCPMQIELLQPIAKSANRSHGFVALLEVNTRRKAAWDRHNRHSKNATKANARRKAAAG